jgi:hypothetical protein
MLVADYGAALLARLLGDAALVALVGDAVDWSKRPNEQGLPAVVLSTVSDPRPDHFGGAQGFRQTRVQADAWSAVSADEASRIAEAVIAAVRPEPGEDGADAAGSWISAGVRFGRPGIDGPVDSGEQLSAIYAYRSRVDILLWHAEMEGV